MRDPWAFLKRQTRSGLDVLVWYDGWNTMNAREKTLHCNDDLLKSCQQEIGEVRQVIASIKWEPDFLHTSGDRQFKHQAAYNRAFKNSFTAMDWEDQPRLSDNPKLIGDFRKNLVFIEVQFGNSSTLYRDFYKFQYGLTNSMLSVAVLIVPNDEYKFFPNRADSVRNMANFSLACRYFTVMPISVPTIIFGLLADNE
jgi:hypothetical protein